MRILITVFSGRTKDSAGVVGAVMGAVKAVDVRYGVNIFSPCHQEFWVHHMVELLPSEQATGQRTPADTHKTLDL